MSRRILAIIMLLALPLQLLAIDNERFRQLRNQSIKNIGWVAGNTAGHPIWPQVEPYVGKGGNYYNTLIRLKTPGANDEVEAYSNVALYREWVEIGEKASFNEKECMTRIQRTLQIVDELTKMMKASH